jgi:predicted RNase H-like HicB family nuclease
VADERRAIAMKRTFAASVTQEGEWYVAQCLEVDVASQGETEEEALANLREALTLALSSPDAMSFPELRMVEIEVGGA